MNEMKRCFSLFGIGRVPPKKTILNACGIQESITTPSIRGYPKFVWCTSFSGTLFKKQLGWMHSEFFVYPHGKKQSQILGQFSTLPPEISISIAVIFIWEKRTNRKLRILPSFPDFTLTRCRTLRELAAHVTTMWGHSWGPGRLRAWICGLGPLISMMTPKYGDLPNKNPMETSSIIIYYIYL